VTRVHRKTSIEKHPLLYQSQLKLQNRWKYRELLEQT
jgi:hypothetical protein